jgi:hypothetical protein
VAVHDAAIEEVEAERGQIGEHDRLGGRVDLGQDIGAEHAADHAGDDEPEEQPPVDVAVGDMADRRDGGGEGLGGMDAGRGARAARPWLISKVLEIWPKAMPSAPSTSCAAKPIRMKGDQDRGIGQIGEMAVLHPC